MCIFICENISILTTRFLHFLISTTLTAPPWQPGGCCIPSLPFLTPFNGHLAMAYPVFQLSISSF